MKTFKITEKTLNDVLGYLNEQKFRDANPLIQALFADAKAPGAMEETQETAQPVLVKEEKAALVKEEKTETAAS